MAEKYFETIFCCLLVINNARLFKKTQINFFILFLGDSMG